jgi:hypothetical protein
VELDVEVRVLDSQRRERPDREFAVAEALDDAATIQEELDQVVEMLWFADSNAHDLPMNDDGPGGCGLRPGPSTFMPPSGVWKELDGASER